MTGTDAPSPLQALEALVSGNDRYARGEPDHPRQRPYDRTKAMAQHRPLAVVVACSDARVPTDVVFDQGIGDLFAVRIAGHVVGEDALSSVRFAVEVLQVPLVAVVGHRGCGAVALAVDAVASGGDLSRPLVRELAPVVKRVRAEAPPGSDLQMWHDRTVDAHAEATARRLASDPELLPAIRAGRLVVRAGVYQMDSGRVLDLDRPVGPPA